MKLKREHKQSLHFAGFVLFALSSTSAHSEISCCGTDLYPSLDVSILSTDNLYNTANNEVSATRFITKPAVHAKVGTNILEFVLDADVEIGRVDISSEDDWEDLHLSAGTVYQPTTRTKLEAGVGIAFEHDDRGTEYTAGDQIFTRDPDEYRLSTLDGKLTYGTPGAKGQIIVDAKYADKDYTNNREFTKGFDHTTDKIGAVFKWRVAPKTQVTLEGRYGGYDYDHTVPGIPELDSNEYRYFVGVEWKATFKTSGRFQIGQLEKDFSSPLREDVDENAWEAGISWRPRSYSVVDLETGRTTSESTGTGDAAVTDYYELSWTHSWLQRFSTNVSYRHHDEDYPGSSRQDGYDRLRLQANYDMRQWLKFEAGYSYAQRDSSTRVFEFDENRLFLRVKMQF